MIKKKEYYHDLYYKSLEQLKAACTDHGIVASTADSDNYKRIWARDAIVSGIAGILANDKIIIQGLKKSLQLLAQNQLGKGTVPSNVKVNEDGSLDVSHGGLVGRVDATSWFVIGACLYIRFTKEDIEFRKKIETSLLKALEILDAWEFNNKHLIYTPLSGNWADEYPLHGYLLYDNCLRYWALKLFADVYIRSEVYSEKLSAIQKAIEINLWPDHNNEELAYHQSLFAKWSTLSIRHFLAGFNPSYYYNIFDTPGIGLAMFLGFSNDQQAESIIQKVTEIQSSISSKMLPAYWPIINEGDPLWNDLLNNYSFSFKNKPVHFHNGGIWPIMMGIFSLGLAKINMPHSIEEFLLSFESTAKTNNDAFREYVDSVKLEPEGKTNMSFTASGIIIMHQCLFEPSIIRQLR